MVNMPDCRTRPDHVGRLQRRALARLVRAGRTEQRLVTRAKIVLDAARGRPTRVSPRRGGWTRTPCASGVADSRTGSGGAGRLERCGRPPVFTPVQVAEIKAAACQLPAETEIPLARWSHPELAREAALRGSSTRSRPPRCGAGFEAALKPWQYRSWISIPDPDFEAKARRVLDLYGRMRDGAPGGNEYVISADEKTSIQARCRCHPTLAPGSRRAMRVDHEYDRGGAVTYLAAYDVHRAGPRPLRPTSGIEPFGPGRQVMNQEPYTSAERVFWIVDNGSSHRGQAHRPDGQQFPNAIMVHTPVHASWLNQVEIFFSVVQRKVLSPNDFTHLDDVINRLAAFETRYNPPPNPSNGSSPPPT